MKTYFFKKALLIGALLIIYSSCKKDQINNQGQEVIKTSLSDNKIYTAQKEFAKILAKAVHEDVQVRQFIKSESLKQFDNDYDILYQVVRDYKIGSETFREKLLKYAKSVASLDSIESIDPLLTIFVPNLPSFSADKWDISNQIPEVAIINTKNNDIYLMNKSGVMDKFEKQAIPITPVIVVKENERVILSNSFIKANKTASNSPVLNTLSTDKYTFTFISSEFDNRPESKLKNIETKRYWNERLPEHSNIDRVNIGAYQAAQNNDQWQRDYVYYGITATNPNGAYQNNYSEFIHSITFEPEALDVMSDFSDPRPYYYNGYTLWTEGNFELQFSVLVNAINGIGTTITKIISVRPTDLFNVEYSSGGFIENITAKQYYANLELVPWDLKNYGMAWKFMVYEVDPSESSTYTYSNSSTFATNFEVNLSIFKIGAKFGSSGTSTNNSSFSITRNNASDFLGETVLTFDQPILTSYNILTSGDLETEEGTTREISTGLLSLSVEPKRVF